MEKVVIFFPRLNLAAAWLQKQCNSLSLEQKFNIHHMSFPYEVCWTSIPLENASSVAQGTQQQKSHHCRILKNITFTNNTKKKSIYSDKVRSDNQATLP
jgi:hypothetical protein